MMSNEVVPTPAAPQGDRSRDETLALRLRVVLARAETSVEALDRAHIESRGVTPGEFSVMEALYHKGPLLLGELQRKVLVSSGGVTYLVDKLTRRGLVERQDCPTDRRARYAALTDEGRRWMDGVFPEHTRCLARALGGLDEKEKEQAIELLRKLGLHAEGLGPCVEGASPADRGQP